jgi:hypothetical protein
VAEISGYRVEEAADACVSHSFAGAEGAAEMTSRLRFGIVARHPLTHVGLGASVEMEPQFLVELAIEGRSAPLIEKAGDE